MKFELINKYNSRAVQDIDALPSIIEKKLSRLDNYFKENAYAKVKVTSSQGSDDCVMEVSVFQPGLTTVPLRAEVIADSPAKAIDLVLPKVERQIRKYKTRTAERKKEKLIIPAELIAAPVKNEPEQTKFGKLVRVKNFAVAHCTIEEAIEDLELLGHDFYIFTNSTDNKLSVLYKRKDSDYGLIVPN